MARTTKAAMRERQALELRMQGLSFDAIARRVGYANKGSAKKAYDRAINGSAVTTMTDDEWRDLELHRLERAHAAVWPAASRGDLSAVRELRHLHRDRVQLKGLGIAPGRRSYRGDDGSPSTDQGGTVTSPDELDQLRQRRAADAADRAARAGS